MNWIIIGNGSAGQRWHRIISENFPDISLRLFPSREFLSATKADFARGHFLRASRVDAAIVCTPASMRNFCSDFLRSGVNLLIEKPISDTAEEAAEICQASETARAVLQIGYVLRFRKVVQEFKRLISSNRLGRILSVQIDCSQYLPFWRPRKNYQISVSANRELGGGVLNELSHELDLAEFLFGPAIAVSCRLRKLSDLEIDVEDYANLELEVQDERSRIIPVSIRLDFGSRRFSRFVEVRGSTGTAYLDLVQSVIRWSDPDLLTSERLVKLEESADQPYIEEIREFRSLVEDHAVDRLSSRHPILVNRTVVAARLSDSRSGERIALGE